MKIKINILYFKYEFYTYISVSTSGDVLESVYVCVTQLS